MYAYAQGVTQSPSSHYISPPPPPPPTYLPTHQISTTASTPPGLVNSISSMGGSVVGSGVSGIIGSGGGGIGISIGTPGLQTIGQHHLSSSSSHHVPTHLLNVNDIHHGFEPQLTDLSSTQKIK